MRAERGARAGWGRLRARTVRAVVCALLLGGAAGPLRAQDPVLLRLRPRVGDTLVTRVEQQVELTGRTRRGGADTVMRVRTRTALRSRILVRGFDGQATLVTTITDSVWMEAEGSASPISPELVQRALEGRRLRMRVTLLGSASLLGAPRDVTTELQTVLSQMPATLPAEPIRAGARWSEAMRLPVAGDRAKGGALLRAVYRLDSLAADGALAFISMRGTIERGADAAPLPNGARMTSSGTMQGALVLDRQRGWWTDAATEIALRSTITPARSGTGAPLSLVMRVTQRMRVLPNP